MTIYLLAGNRIAELSVPVWLLALVIGIAVGLAVKPLINLVKSDKWQKWFWGLSK